MSNRVRRRPVVGLDYAALMCDAMHCGIVSREKQTLSFFYDPLFYSKNPVVV